MKATLALADGTKVRTKSTFRYVVVARYPKYDGDAVVGMHDPFIKYRTDDVGRARAARAKLGGFYTFPGPEFHSHGVVFDTTTGEVV